MEVGRSIETARANEAARSELLALRRRASELEASLAIAQEGLPDEAKKTENKRAAAHAAVTEAWRAALRSFSAASQTSEHRPEIISLKLAPEAHDARMNEFIGTLEQHGAAAAIRAAEASGNLHLMDDFHRILVEWVHEGLPAQGTECKPYKTALRMMLFEIELARGKREGTGDAVKMLHDFISLMEQFYRSSLQMDAKHGEHISFEIANPAGSAHTRLYMAIPAARKTLLEKSLSALYPSLRLTEVRDDYNVFTYEAQVAAAYAKQKERPIYALRTFDAFASDPMNILLNAFSKLDPTSEGAAAQFIISPQDEGLVSRYRQALEKARSGTPLEEATKIRSGLMRAVKELYDAFQAPANDEKNLRKEGAPRSDDPRLKSIERKIESPLVLADIRLVSSAATKARAKTILEDLEASFQQLGDTAGNAIVFNDVSAWAIKSFSHAFSYRLFEKHSALPLSTAELATMAHLPQADAQEAAPALEEAKSRVAPAPLGLGQEGVLLGVNRFRGTETLAYLGETDRLRHFYCVGQTGTGKSHLLKNLIAQDIRAGAGVCFIDPHGTDVLDVLSVVPKERVKDVIYFDPAYIERPMGLNMLEYDRNRPEQKTLVVDELLGIFNKLFDLKSAGGPAFEQYFRNAALLVMEDPDSGNTLLDIARLFSDEAFRAVKLSRCKNETVRQFWEGIALRAQGEQTIENWGPYITSKFDNFTSNEIIRPIISQQRSAFNFREIMDNKKILLVNLAKGRVGDLSANLLGLIIVGKFLIAALSRADSFGKDFPAFYLYIDEFQNFATPSIATILSEARKYKLSLTVAHQFIAQLTDEIRNAVFGNVGSLCAFRVGAQDAEALEKQFAPTFSAPDLMRIDNYRAHLKLLVNGKPALPFDISTLPFEGGDHARAERMAHLSFLTYGVPKDEIGATNRV